jgi:hypothetical protein
MLIVRRGIPSTRKANPVEGASAEQCARTEDRVSLLTERCRQTRDFRTKGAGSRGRGWP